MVSKSKKNKGEYNIFDFFNKVKKNSKDMFIIIVHIIFKKNKNNQDLNYIKYYQ